MTQFKYLKLTKTKRIRYLTNFKRKNTYIVFLHGFKSDLEGQKPKTFLRFAKNNNLGFLGLEYSGHGKSSGKFVNGNITKWTNETSKVIRKIVKKNKMILIGSSMGSWISLNQFRYFKNQIIGFLGIGSAPEFLEHLMWRKFTKKMKSEIIKNGIYNLKHGNYTYPITHQLIKDGKQNKVLHKKILTKIKVIMIHGQKDESVPVIYSKKILKIFPIAEKRMLIVKNGDHSLSSPKWLKLIKKELRFIVN